MPVGRVEASARPTGRGDGPGRPGDGADEAAPPVADAAHVFWHPAPPPDGSPERDLFEQLAARGLLLEPFERAADGLREVYGARSNGPDAT